MKLKEIHIKGFRGIKDQTINNIENALVLIGKNNAGKSAFLTAIRTFFGDYTPQDKDIYKGSNDFEIEAVLECDDDYISEFFLDSKIGFTKVPSSSSEYKEIITGTSFESVKYTEFKEMRNKVIEDQLIDDVNTRETYLPLWIKAIHRRLDISNGLIKASLIYKRGGYKVEYSHNKEIVNFLPSVAFIDDSRNFSDEEVGKTKTITASVFNNILKSELFSNAEFNCDDCNSTDCESKCIVKLETKKPTELSIEELQKLINFKTKNTSMKFTSSISDRFAKNYQSGFKVNIKATSNIDKSFSIITKLYDPALDSEVELSNVGAGVRSVYILSLLQTYQAISAKHTIFIIEEPELYLHPQLQKSMAKTLSEISDNNQVIFTSHSPIMLREFSTNDIRKVKLDESNYCSIVTETTIDDVLNEIGYSSQDILNTDFVFFVEGPDDKKILEFVLKKYYDVELERIAVIDTKSCNNLNFYASLRFLDKTTIGDDFAIIRDADTKSKEMVERNLSNQLKSNINDKFAAKAISLLYITKYSSIEGFLFSPELLVSHGLYNKVEDVYDDLQKKLTDKKQKFINYFEEQNKGDTDRIDLFKSDYDSKIGDVKGNLDWIKTYIKGHDYFNPTKSKCISYEKYVDELSEEAFEDLLEFLNNLPYFNDKKL